MSKIAGVNGISKDEVYEIMLQKYGTFYEGENGLVTITVKSNVDMSKIDGHWKWIKGNETWSAYAMIKGSSEYNTKEMSVFIDGIVSEAEGLKIQTKPPEEIERMKSLWQTSGKAY